MAKKIRKRRANYFDNGGFSWQKGAGFGKNMGNAFNSGALNSAIGAASSIAGQGISGRLSSEAGNAIQGLGSIANAIPGPWGAVAGAGLNILGGLTNKLFGSTINEQAVADFENQNAQQGSMQFSANNTTDLVNQGNFGLLSAINKSDVGKDGVFSNKAQRITDRLNRERNMANAQAIGNYFAAAQNVDAKQDALALANYAAYGGPLTMRYTGTMSPFGNTFADGGKIYIKPENRGKFTALKERTGKSATWFKEHGTPAQKKMATFALNSKHWSHADGGPLRSLVRSINKRSNADFVQRLLDPNRDYIQDWESDNIATHKLGWATDDKGAIVFPNIQRINGKLYDFTDPKNKRGEWDALESAIQRGDTLRMTPSQAKEFTENYKKYYPKGVTFRAFGGDLITNGAEWDNGLTIIGNGGTHEENPMEGVQMGMDAQGIPNLVEEGEVIFNDYVFSDRMKVPKAIRSKYKLRENKDITFADAAKKIAKESEERPNDPISRRGLMSSMTRLQQAQEAVREERQASLEERQYAHGGRMGNLFDGTGPDENFLELSRGAHLYGNSVPDNTEVATPSIYDTNGILTPEGLTASRAAHLGVPISEIQAIDANANSQGNTGGNTNTNNRGSNSTWMRYAPIAAAGAGILTDALGWTNKPDYSNADTIFDTINSVNYTPVSAAPLGNYLTYNPFDRNYYINKLNAESGATRRAIVNQSAGNRATALAGLLAADYNTQGKLGDLARQAEEYNLAQREKVATFNRGTNQFNSEMGLKAAMANQSALASLRDYKLKGTLAAAQMRENTKRLADTNRSANLTNFTQGLGDIGSENVGWNQLQWAMEHGVFGPMQDKISKGYRRKNGGKLLTKRG